MRSEIRIEAFTFDSLLENLTGARRSGLCPQDDGFYHVHLMPGAVAVLEEEAHWRRLLRDAPGEAIGAAVGCYFYGDLEGGSTGATLVGQLLDVDQAVPDA